MPTLDFAGSLSLQHLPFPLICSSRALCPSCPCSCRLESGRWPLLGSVAAVEAGCQEYYNYAPGQVLKPVPFQFINNAQEDASALWAGAQAPDCGTMISRLGDVALMLDDLP